MLRIIYHIILSLWIGGIALFTFIVTPAIFRSFDRDMASVIVDKLFPGYFLFLLLTSLAALALYLIQWISAKSGSRAAVVLLVLAVAMNLFISFKLHPDIKKVKAQIQSFETTPQDSPMRSSFRRLHAVSAVLNLLILADGTSLLVISLIGKR